MIHSIKPWKSIEQLEALLRERCPIEVTGTTWEKGGMPEKFNGNVYDLPYGHFVSVRHARKEYQFWKGTDGELHVLG